MVGAELDAPVALGVLPEMTTALEASLIVGAATRLARHNHQASNATTTTSDVPNARRLRIQSAKPKPMRPSIPRTIHQIERDDLIELRTAW
jgi:hypothetical protein